MKGKHAVQYQMNLKYDFATKPNSHPRQMSEDVQKTVEHDETCKSITTHSSALNVYHNTTSNEIIAITSESEMVSHSDASEGRSRTNEGDFSKHSDLLQYLKYEHDTPPTDLKKKYTGIESSSGMNSNDSGHLAKDSNTYDNKHMSN